MPFDDLFDTLGAFDRKLFPTSQGAVLHRQQERSAQLEAFRKAVLDQMQRGTDLSAAVNSVLSDPAIQPVLAQPDFPKNAQEFIELLTPEPDEYVGLAPSASAMNKRTGELGVQAPGKPPEPTAAEKLVDAILTAETPEERKLLERHLPVGTDGRLSVTDALRLAAGGIPFDPKLLPKAISEMPTQAGATIALTLGQGGPRAPNTTDMLLAAMGIPVPGSPLNDLPKADIRNGLLAAEQLRRAEAKPGPLDAILAASPEARAAGLVGEQGGGLAELFEKMDKAEAAQRGEKVIEPSTGEVPVFGAAPQAGGTGGQAPGPAVGGALTPEQSKAIEAMPPENFAELSPETLDQITRAVLAKTLTLSNEQRQALLAANQANQANQGGSGGGTQ